DFGHWTLDIGHWTLDIGHWTLDIGHWTLDIGHWTLDPHFVDFMDKYKSCRKRRRNREIPRHAPFL
ncbi:hypothetical protein BDR05DRAFT_896657, partial [Suillus weaverae]